MSNFIIFDLEWNQSPAGKETSVEHLPFEIFEIGAVKLNENLEQVSGFHRLIKLSVYQEIHPIISGVTHISKEELEEKGESFSHVMREFLAWCGEGAVFGTWGSMDLTELQRNMAYHGMENPFPRPLLFYDIQKLYSIQFSDGKSRESLDHAANERGLSCEAPFHRAYDDAVYTGKLFSMLNFENVRKYVSVDYYRAPANKKEELTLEFPEYSKFVSRGFPSKEAAMADKRVTDVICYKCHRMLRKKIRWFSYGQRYYLCLAACPEHGPVKGKIRMKKAEDGSVFAVRTTKLVAAEGAELVVKKKEETRIRHGERVRTKSSR